MNRQTSILNLTRRRFLGQMTTGMTGVALAQLFGDEFLPRLFAGGVIKDG